MRAKTLQIRWHGASKEREPIYSVDFSQDGRLITAGADKEIKIWEVTTAEDGYASANHLCTLSGHSKTINCVRVSPTGGHLVSTADGGEILLWQPNDTLSAASSLPKGNLVETDPESDGTPVWRRVTTLRGHNDDVMDVSWATDGTALLTGSIDNKAIIWEVSDKNRGKILAQLANHKHFIQGVAWDPAQQFVVTQSTDRTCRVYSLKPPASGSKRSKQAQWALPAAQTASDFYCSHTLSKRSIITATTTTTTTTTTIKDSIQGGKETGDADGDGDGAQHPTAPGTNSPPPPQQQKHPLFHDETINSFFRRLSWSPDGSFLVIPAGIFPSCQKFQDKKSKGVLNTAYIYARGKWTAPVMHLPGHDRPIIAVRFCPVIFACDKVEKTCVGSDTVVATADAAGALPLSPTDATALNTETTTNTTTNTATTSSSSPLSTLPYKLVFAVATTDSVIIYDTQSTLPVAVLGALHYASITDLAWSSDGTYLAVGSKDGYCSVAVFEKNELGEPMMVDDLPGHVRKRMMAAQRKIEPIASNNNSNNNKKNKASSVPAQQLQGEKTGVAVEAVAAAAPLPPPPQQQQQQQQDKEKKKRIQPQLISLPSTDADKKQPQKEEERQDAAAAAAAVNSSGGKRRITPTMITNQDTATNSVPTDMQGVAAVVSQAAASRAGNWSNANEKKEGGSSGGRSEKKRRITPIPIVSTTQVGLGQPKQEGETAVAVAPVTGGGGMSIAALAAMAGRSAAPSTQQGA